MLILPKRGLSAPQDTERMRELLAAALIDQHSVRAARQKGSDQPEEGPSGAEVVRDA
ncbi:hypothetical protein [Streptomyces sp. V1I1]|uniref:hypothetical protein n=1 Tax=Streptomyces sp. V1I1 TaxID=3042272 RepID=UPI002786A2BC|nr:hypothetical protein [Streptomyces sp. V1I1]MDQ0941934.1 hypothetical protein [Streptomyces sp. V1I1]